MFLLPLLLAASAPVCPSTAFVTLEHGRIASATWTQRTEGELKSHSVLSQTLVIDATITLRPDATASHATSQRSAAGAAPGKPGSRDLPAGAVPWSDVLPSTLEQVVLRAKAMGKPTTELTGASIFSDVKTPITVEKLDATDWAVSVNKRRYEVLTDANGCLLTAELPEYGIAIERRPDFTEAQYPLWAPYAAAPDGAYTARDVRIKAPQGHVLAGTLVRPKRSGKLPAAVFITGISAHERNCGAPPFMPFRDLSDALARVGVASLRADDRGVAQSTGDRDKAMLSDKVDDMQALVAWLRTQPDIDPARIFLVGYSEGGTLANIVASRDPKIAGIVSIAGNGVLPWDLYRYQTEIAVNADPTVPAADKKKEIEKELAEPMTPHEKSFMELDPLKPASAVKCPALLLQGGNDLHVPPRSAERLATTMRANGNRDVTVRLITGTGHFIVPDPIGLASFWPMLPAHLVLPEIQDEVASWVAAHAAEAHAR